MYKLKKQVRNNEFIRYERYKLRQLPELYYGQC